MQRRTFMQSSFAALGASTFVSAAAPPTRPTQDYYELRTFSLKPSRLAVLEDYLSKALIPALKRSGAGPIGAFIEKADKQEIARLYLLITSPSAELLATQAERLAADAAYCEAAAGYLAVKPSDPVYSRIDSSLLAAITGMPRLALPDTKKPRLFNLRIYESHNERAAAKKIEMFNQGELSIFQRVGLTPVFFGSALVGANLPNLTYMLVFPDDAGLNTAWSIFRNDAEWHKLRAIPEYADKEIVSRITNKLLAPASYSEI